MEIAFDPQAQEYGPNGGAAIEIMGLSERKALSHAVAGEREIRIALGACLRQNPP
jgi:hypothetical protein